MKKIVALIAASLLLTACSPVDSVRTMDQPQTENLVRSMYPVETNARMMAPVTRSK